MAIKSSFSLPESVFEALDIQAEQESVSRSAIILKALQQYLGQCEKRALIERINAVVDSGHTEEDALEDELLETFRRAAIRRQAQRYSDDQW